jgi:hypothetical protein
LNELINEAKFPDGTDLGPSGDVIGFRTGGNSGDWIAHDLDIPAAEYEIGDWIQYKTNWLPLNKSVAF